MGHTIRRTLPLIIATNKPEGVETVSALTKDTVLHSGLSCAYDIRPTCNSLPPFLSSRDALPSCPRCFLPHDTAAFV